MDSRPYSPDPALLERRVIDWFALHARDLPWRADDFTPWGVLVSEFMLQQTPVNRVIDRLEQWLRRWPTPADLAAAPVSEALRAWDRLGYPRRALWLHACAVRITAEHGGEVPDDVPDLLALPGVGPYTARAVAAFAYGKRHPVVDTNIRRVIARAVDGYADASTARTTTDLAAMERLLPESEQAAQQFNAGMMELGALICTARTPKCDACPLRDLCAWRRSGYPDNVAKKRTPQKKYEGSDRQVRGLMLHRLRDAVEPVPRPDMLALWPDTVQARRALAGLCADGLATEIDGAYALPE